MVFQGQSFLLYRYKKKFAYAAALLDSQNGEVGLITKGNGIHFFRKFYQIYSQYIFFMETERLTPGRRFLKVGFRRFQKV